MTTPKYPKTNINPIDKEWLKARAQIHHRTVVGEISAVRDIVEYFERNGLKIDFLPHPEGGEIVPVLQMENSHG